MPVREVRSSSDHNDPRWRMMAGIYAARTLIQFEVMLIFLKLIAKNHNFPLISTLQEISNITYVTLFGDGKCK